MRQYLLFISLFFIPQIIFAQWKGDAELGGSFFKGNINKLDLRSVGNLAHKDSSFEFSAFYKTIYSETDNVQNNEELSGGIKFDYLPQNRFSPFVVFSVYKNDFKDIHYRISSIIGGKYVLYETDASSYSMSMAYQYDVESYVSETPAKNKMRISVRPKIKQNLGPNTYFENITFYRPNIENFQDFVIESTSSLTNKITEKIYLKVVYDYEYVNQPTKEGLLRTDQSLVLSLKLKF
jgi:hypothetical protein